MSNTEGSTLVFAGIITLLAVFFAPYLLALVFGGSVETVLWGLISLAAAGAVICLVRLRQRIKSLEAQAARLRELLDRLEKKADDLP